MKRRQTTAFAFGMLAAFAAQSSCRRDGPPIASTQPSAVGASSAPGERLSSPSARLQAPAWRRAASDDPLEHARLAAAEGASGLLEALDDGGSITAAALLALPYADDADLALGPLTARARTAEPGLLRPLLQAVLEIAGRPARPREPLDPEGTRTAAASLLELARRHDLPPELRALAVSSARALAEKGLLDAAEIPADLDLGAGAVEPAAVPSGSSR